MATELPFAPQSEAAVLCCMIENPQRFTSEAWQAQLLADFFHDPAHSALWSIMMDRARADRPTDPASLREAIRDKRPAALSLSRFSEILLTEFSEDSWSGYIEDLRDRYARRVAIQAGQGVVDENLSGEAAIARLRRATEAAVGALTGASAILDSKRSIAAFLASMRDRRENGVTPGLTTGVPALDELTGGLRRGELWVIGAKTSGGKSVFMLQVAIQAIRAGKKVAIFSLEMSADEVVGRLIACGWSVSIAEILNPRSIKEVTFRVIKRAADELENSGMMICDSADLSIEAISAHCQRVAETSGLDLVVIDYIQLVAAPHVKGQNREQEVAGISRGCKQLAKRVKCPVITATQLNEQGKARESRAIEHDADAVFFITPDDEEGNSTFHGWKCRNGKRGETFKARLDGAKQKFTFY